MGKNKRRKNRRQQIVQFTLEDRIRWLDDKMKSQRLNKWTKYILIMNFIRKYDYDYKLFQQHKWNKIIKDTLATKVITKSSCPSSEGDSIR